MLQCRSCSEVVKKSSGVKTASPQSIFNAFPSLSVVDIDILNMSTPQQKEVEEETSPNADDNAVSSDNWDNSDHQKTTAAVTPSPTGMTPQAASSDKEESFSRTYGLLGGDEEDEVKVGK